MSIGIESSAVVDGRRVGPDGADGAPDFGWLAGAYRWMEWLSFGPLLGLCRAEFLGRMGDCKHALVLGDGDGRFTGLLLRECQQIKVHAVDGSSGMLDALVRNCGADGHRLTTERADLRCWQAPAGSADEFDLVVTHFFLDCLSTDEIFGLARRIRPKLSPGALWVVSEFAVPQGWFGRLVAGPIVNGLYLAFGLLTGLRMRRLPEYGAALRDAGFVRIGSRARLGGLLVSELWALFQEG